MNLDSVLVRDDTQEDQPKVKEAIDKVGVEGIRTHVRIIRQKMEFSHLPIIDMNIDLPANKKGVHMSRLLETINEVISRKTNGLKESLEEFGFEILEEMQEKHQIIGDVRGKGLMIGVELVKNRKTKEPAKKATHDLIMNVWKKGVALISAGLSTLRIAPPIVISQDLVDTALPIIEEEIAIASKKIH